MLPGKHGAGVSQLQAELVPTALQGADQLAIGAVQAAHALGHVVPRDLSVVGFDDIPRATTWEPQLTTIRQPLVDKGRLAARLLLDAIDGAGPTRLDLPVELVVRQSTGPPRM